MFFVPVVSNSGQPLDPCHPARCRELVRNGEAVRRFNRGWFYIQLTVRSEGVTHPTSLGIDPGSKKEGLTVKSAHHTFVNVQADAVTWVKDAVETRREMRRGRRFRKTPCRQKRSNRGVASRLPPSTRARWGWKLRIAKWLGKMYPITVFVVEDIATDTRKGQRKWNASFSPLEVGKKWFYAELRKLGRVETKQGWETAALREHLGLRKSDKKMAETFSAHAVDSWVLANSAVGGHKKPDNEDLLAITPLRFHRRQLHRLQPEVGGKRKPYGGTRSEGFTRGSLVTHPKHGLTYIGGGINGRVSLHAIATGKRLTQNAKPQDVNFLTYNTWRTRFLPSPKRNGFPR